MHEELIYRWNLLVDYTDTVFVLGDFCFGGREKKRAVLSRLHGYKILVRGNHDDRSHPQNLAAGFDQVTLSVCRQIGKHNVLMSHYPYLAHDERYADRMPKDEGLWLLHGHVHKNWKINGRQINVGVDVWDYAPISEDDVLAIMNSGD